MYPLFCVFRDIAMRFVTVFEAAESSAIAGGPPPRRSRPTYAGKAVPLILYTQKKYEKIAHGNGASKLRIAKVRVIIK